MGGGHTKRNILVVVLSECRQELLCRESRAGVSNSIDGSEVLDRLRHSFTLPTTTTTTTIVWVYTPMHSVLSSTLAITTQISQHADISPAPQSPYAPLSHQKDIPRSGAHRLITHVVHRQRLRFRLRLVRGFCGRRCVVGAGRRGLSDFV